MSTFKERSLAESLFNILTSLDTYNRGLSSCEPDPKEILKVLFVECLVVWLLIIYAFRRNGFPYHWQIAIISVIGAFATLALFVAPYVIRANTPYNIYYYPSSAATYACMHGYKQISLQPLLENSTAFLTKIWRYTEGSNTAWGAYYVSLSAIAALQSHTLQEHYALNCSYVCHL